MTQLQPDLRGIDYSRQNLRSCSFRFADLRGANFSDCDLTGADFRWADLRDVCFDGAVLDHADLSGATSDPDFRQERHSAKPLKKYRVTVEFTETEDVEVKAIDEKEAKRLAFDEIGGDIIYCEELKS